MTSTHIIERILRARRGAKVLVASPHDDPATILGYLVNEGPVIHTVMPYDSS